MAYAILDSRDIVADFYPRLETELANQWSNQVGLYLQSDQEIEHYRWLGQAPGLRKWLGGRHERVLNRFSYDLMNEKYEDTLVIPVDDLRRDKTGQLRIRVGQMAAKAATHWNSLLSTVITANGNGYDGVAFYSTVHAESGVNQKNLLTSSDYTALDVAVPTAPTATEFAAALIAVLGHFFSLTDDQGDPANGEASSFIVQVGTAQLWGPLVQAIGSTFLANGVSNPLAGFTSNAGISVTPQLNPRLSSFTSSFFVHRTNGDMRAFILQDEVPLETSLLGAGSEEEVKNDRHLFGLKAVRAAGFGLWNMSIKATLS